MRNKLMVMLVLGCMCFLTAPASHAQAAASKDSQTVTDQDVKLLRQDIQSRKKQLIAANLTLTDSEATKFWPVYDQSRRGDEHPRRSEISPLIKEYLRPRLRLADRLPCAGIFCSTVSPLSGRGSRATAH